MTGRFVSRAGLGAAMLIAAAVRAPHLRFVPIWDGRQYWEQCIHPALTAPSFDPLAFNCFGHRSMLYMLTMALPQYLSMASPVLLNLTHMVVSLLTIAAFHRALVNLFPPADEAKSGIDAALLTILFAAMPAWTASSINLNPDMGVLTGFTFALAFLLAGRRHWAVAAGLFLVLSKEIGLLLWLLLAFVESVLAMWQSESRLRELARRWTYVLPPAAYFAVGLALSAQDRPATWGTEEHRSGLLQKFLTLDFTAPHYVAYAADLFVLNFAWVMAFVIVAWLIAVLGAIFKKQPMPLVPSIDRRRGLFIALVAPGVAYLVTRFPTFNNVRYLLAAFPMLVIAFGIAAAAVIPRTRVRASVIAAAAVLQLASMWYTIDPVSRFIFGTFPFGRREMLHMTSLRNECCGFGRDQLVYNLQFTNFDSIQRKVFATIRPREGEPIATAHMANWFIHSPLDPRTYERSMGNGNAIRPHYLTVMSFQTEPLPPRMRYIAYPNVDNRRDLAMLARAYSIKRPVVIEDNGYEAAVFELERRVVVVR